MTISLKIKALAAAVAIATIPASAMAVTTFDGTPTVSGGMGVGTSGNGTNFAAATFNWNGTPATGSIQFTASKAFDLLITAVTGPLNKSRYALTGPGGVLTSDQTTCGLIAAASCNTFTPSDVGSTPFSLLSAGTYTLEVFEGNSPEERAATFAMAAIPLPAGAVLLLTAFGGMAVLRRRQTVA